MAESNRIILNPPAPTAERQRDPAVHPVSLPGAAATYSCSETTTWDCLAAAWTNDPCLWEVQVKPCVNHLSQLSGSTTPPPRRHHAAPGFPQTRCSCALGAASSSCV